MDRREFLAAAAAPIVLGALPSRARAGGGTPLALVTADLEAAIVAVDLDTGRVVRRIATASGPRSIEAVDDGVALVAHTARGEVTLLDAARLSVRPVGGSFGAPRYTAADGKGRFAYVSDSERGEVAIVDVRARRVVRRVAVGGPARHLSLDPLGRRLWVVLGSKSAEIAIIGLDGPRGPQVVDRVRPPFLAHDVGYEPRGARVWVTSGDRRRLAIYDDHGTRLIRTLRGDAPPQHVTFLAGRAFVTSGDDAVLRVHALDGRLLRSARIPVGSYNVQRAAGVVLTPSLQRGTLCVVTARGVPIEELRVASSSHDACFVMRR